MRFRVRFWSICRRIPRMGHLPEESKTFIKMILKMWREEFQVGKFKLNHPTADDFVTCCWQKRRNVLPIWILYRTALAFYFLISFVYTIYASLKDEKIPKADKTKTLIFLTNWTYLMQMFTFALGDVIAIRSFNHQRKGKELSEIEHLPWCFKVFWASYSIAASASVIVTGLFWTAVYDAVLFPVNAPNLILHAFNSVFMILDFILVAHPIRFLHIYWPYVYAMIYVLFSVVYEFSGGTGVKGVIPIYKVLDWVNDPVKSLLFCTVACFGVLFAHVLFCLFSLFKLWLRKKYVT